MNELFYVVSMSEGDTTIEALTRDTLQNRLDNHYWGDVPGFPRFISLRELAEGQSISSERKEGLLIIKGIAVLPQPETVVTKFKVE